MRTARTCLGFAIALLVPNSAPAQNLPSPGELVRVWGPMPSMALMENESRESELAAIRGDTLVFETPGSDTQVAVARDRIRRLDVRQPRTPAQGAVLGATVGLALGVVAGLVLAATKCDDDSCYVNATILLGGAGGGVGALIGCANPGTRWERVHP